MHHFTVFRSKEKRINTIFFTYILLSRYKPPTIGSSWRLSENIPVSCLLSAGNSNYNTCERCSQSNIKSKCLVHFFITRGTAYR